MPFTTTSPTTRSRPAPDALQSGINRMVEALSAPIIVADHAWGETIPADLLAECKTQRMVAFARAGYADWNEATDAEVTAYLYTAGLLAPMQRDYADVYLWLGKKWKPAIGELAPDELSPDQERLLRELRVTLRNKQRNVYRAGRKA